ncbi:MAG: ribonuclease III [Chromatiaceae bacterium]
MVGDPSRLARILGYSFAHPDLLIQALTHRSAPGISNERLEFLGDALLGFVIAEALWQLLPEADEGDLSRTRASLVKKEALARLARLIKLGDYLRLGPGESRTGAHGRDSILEDALEAVFGAVFLDAGFEPAKTLILKLFREPLAEAVNQGQIKDPKTRLQEGLQAGKRPLPLYEILAIGGSQHEQSFRVACLLPDTGQTTQGSGTSRRRAEQEAAELMLEQIAHDI